VDQDTVAVYEQSARRYAELRQPRHRERAAAFSAGLGPEAVVADLGCGPGLYLPDLGPSVVGLDAAHAMLVEARDRGPGAAAGVPLVQADLEALPFRDGSLGAAWARNTYVHLPRERLPLALAHLHRALAVGAPTVLTALVGDDEGPRSDDDLPGRFFSRWPPDRFAEVVAGAGLAVESVEVVNDAAWVSARRDRTLPDFVGPGMRLLVCGLNPSLVAADAGYGYAGRTNRFWTAAVAAGLVTRPREPLAVLSVDRVGMTDLVKRATPRADLLSLSEYQAGADRVRRLVTWLQPAAVLFVGLAGWRAAISRTATAGWQPDGFAGVPAYVMPSTSGLNARTTLAELADHIHRSCSLPG
jgi:double-stranded uracil-DNA glycosylase